MTTHKEVRLDQESCNYLGSKAQSTRLEVALGASSNPQRQTGFHMSKSNAVPATTTAPKISDQEKKAARAAKKVENFKKLATKRVNRAIKQVKLIQPLANTGAYTYDDSQVEKIIGALAKAVDDVRNAFTQRKAASVPEVTF